MSRLSKLIGKPVEVKIEGESLLIKPLTMKDMDVIVNLGSEDSAKQAKAITSLIKLTLKNSVPEATDEEIEGVAIAHFQELSEAIMRVNGLDDGVAKKNTPLKKQ
jgi:hypothetical protein|tara:strand:- start:121 stop:435 length:315 start_codon:yes stop_codon:yes gene_type:complete